MKKIVSFLLITLFCGTIFANSVNDSQVFKSDHWIYDAMDELSMESKNTLLIDIQPLSVGELKFNLKQIDYEKLSATAKSTYDKVYEFLYEQKALYNSEGLKLDFNLLVTPEVYYKKNSDTNTSNPTYIDWTFNYFYKDNVLTLPALFGFGKNLLIETDLFIGKNYGASKEVDSFTNIPLNRNINEFEFTWPRFAYGSSGFYFNDWGINIHIGKEGLNYGKTQMESIFYSSKFETDSYVQANVYSKYGQLSLSTIEIDNSHYLYMHQIDIHPFKNFRVGVVEGSMVYGPFEFRFLNPLMIYHSYNSWIDAVDPENNEYYTEDNFCSYFGFTFDFIPFKNLRLYGVYSQIEIQTAAEKKGFGGYRPDSLGFQGGIEYNLPVNKNGLWKFNIEAAYTSPYLYIKQTPYSSLYRSRTDNLNYDFVTGRHDKIKTWIGSPYGPDCFAINTKITYQKKQKWSANFDYRFVIHGENDFSLMENTADIKIVKDDYGEHEIYIYYPFAKAKYANRMYKNKQITEEEKNALLKEAWDEATNMWMTGNKTYLNQFAVEGTYEITKKMSVSGKFVYSLLFQNDERYAKTANGFEVDLSFTYKLFE